MTVATSKLASKWCVLRSGSSSSTVVVVQVGTVSTTVRPERPLLK